MHESRWTVVWIDDDDEDRYELCDTRREAADLVNRIIENDECHPANILVFPPNTNMPVEELLRG